jgi:hypothetical protein
MRQKSAQELMFRKKSRSANGRAKKRDLYREKQCFDIGAYALC